MQRANAMFRIAPLRYGPELVVRSTSGLMEASGRVTGRCSHLTIWRASCKPFPGRVARACSAAVGLRAISAGDTLLPATINRWLTCECVEQLHITVINRACSVKDCSSAILEPHLAR